MPDKVRTAFDLLTVIQTIQAGLKRHFKAARFDREHIAGSGVKAEFDVQVIGKYYRITVQEVRS